LAWTGNEWKLVLEEHAAHEIAALNTPNPENVARLTRRLLGHDATTHWYWTRTSVSTAKARLDAFIVASSGGAALATVLDGLREREARKRDLMARLDALDAEERAAGRASEADHQTPCGRSARLGASW
jgi:anti-sigma-K factor RskA